ncbi:MAG: T9SS type A sorting domain-containing protein, partial [Lewinella sp.]|nr:T9SS type A sorting domain-containing protein [Lewinella sp.]
KVISVDFLSSRGNVQVFPNPSGRNFNIHIDNIRNRQLKVQVLNSLGSVVWKSGLVENVSSYRQELEIDENGIYFIAILIGKEVHAEKLIILNK